MGGFMCIDMEQLKYREITVELFKRLRSAPEFLVSRIFALSSRPI